MNNTEIKQFTDKELLEKIEDEKNLLNRLKLNHAVTPLENPMKLSLTRKNIARLNTELRKRQLEAKK